MSLLIALGAMTAGAVDASGAAQTLAELRTLVAGAAEGATVKLAEGTYTSDATFALELTRAVHVEAAGDRAKTIIKLASGKAGIKVACEGASVSGLTINPNGQSGHVLDVSAGMVTNCVVTGGIFSATQAALVSGTGILDGVDFLDLPTTARRSRCVEMTGGIVRNCTIRGIVNTTFEPFGCGAHVNAGLMENCIIEYCQGHSNNAKDEINGALYIGKSDKSTLGTGEVRNCIVRYNGVKSGCAGVQLSSGTFHDSLVYCNVASNCQATTSGGGGVRVCGSTARMYNCRVSRNCTLFDAAKKGYSGVQISAGVVSNCVVYGNFGGDLYKSGGTVKDTCAGNVVEGEGNTVADPQFRNPQADDYTLLPTSPYAEPSETAAIGFSVGALETKLVGGSASVSFTALKNAIADTLAYSWNFGDGSSATGANVTHEYKAGGDFAVTLSAGGYSCTRTIRIIPPVCHVWTGGSNTAPYDTKEKAATSFATAYNYGSDEIDVHPGTYGCGSSYSYTAVGRAVHVKGIGADVVFSGLNTVGNRAMTVGHPDAFVENVTLTKGNLQYCSFGASGLCLTEGVVSNCVITGNTHYYGGAVHLSGGRLVDCTVTKNSKTSSEFSGGVCVDGTGKVIGCRITNNTSSNGNQGGNGIYVNSDNCIVSNCVICGNTGNSTSTKTDAGGTVRIAKGLVVNCIITNNTVQKLYGAGVYMSGGTLRGCLVANNSFPANAGMGGGVYQAGGTVESCTITGNTAANGSTPGSGLYQAGGTVLNTIVYGNTTDNFNYQSGTVTYTCASETLTGTGNTSFDPSLDKNNYHLTSLSTAVTDTGLNQTWMEGATDLDGTNRIVNTTVDMGAFEFVPPTDVPFTVNFEASSVSGSAPLDVTFTATVTRYEAKDCTFEWTFSDGTKETVVGVATVDHQFAAGTFSATLVVSKGTESCTQTRENYIKVKPSVCYVSTNGLNQSPYADWKTAATNLETALAMEPATIYIGDGTYEVTNTVNVNYGVRIASVNGRDNVRIRRAASLATEGEKAPNFPVLVVNNADAIVEGLTVSHGYYFFANASDGGSNLQLLEGSVKNCRFENGTGHKYAACLVSGGLLEDSVITNNYSNGNWGYGAGLTQLGGTVAGCTITRNHAYGSANQVYLNWYFCQGASISGGVMSNCTIEANYCTERSGVCGGVAIGGGLVTHCRILNNTVAGRTGGVFLNGGTLRNSLVAGNVSQSSDADLGGGAGVTQLGGAIENCTITANSGVIAGSGLKSVGGTVSNTIVYGNVGGADFDNAGDIVPVTSLFTDPLFKGAGDYRLTDFSPAVDAGTDQDWMEGAQDLAGTDRVIGEAVDIGAYELDSSASGLLCHFDVTSSVRGADYNTTATFAAQVRGDGGEAVTYYWTFGDGTAETAGTATPSHIYEPGKYTVTLRVTCGGETASVTRENVVVAIPHEVTVAVGESIADAISGGADIIYLAAGTHEITEGLILSRAVEVKSVSGNPAETVIHATNTISRLRVMQLASADAKLSGVTLRGGNMQVANEYVPGSLLWIQDGTVEDCILEDGLCYYWANVWLDGGTLRRSIIRNSQTTSSSANGVGLGLTAGLADHCIVSNNHSDTHQKDVVNQGGGVYLSGTGVLRNSLVAGNKAVRGGGILVAADATGSIESCTVAGNEAWHENGTCGGICMTDGATATIVNTIVWSNTAATNDDINDATPFSYSCAPTLTAGVNHNLASDPLFRRPAKGDWRLRGSSPCVAAGRVDAWMSGATDLNGRTRTVAGEVSMGAYEGSPIGLTILVR